MGENKHIKELDAFAKKYVKEIKTESPSKDFTHHLMQTILAEQKNPVFKAKELISKKVWFLVAAAFIAILFIPIKNTDNKFLNFPKIDFSFFDKIQFFHFMENLNVSTTTFYAFLLFGIMGVIQVLYLKKYFDKRLE